MYSDQFYNCKHTFIGHICIPPSVPSSSEWHMVIIRTLKNKLHWSLMTGSRSVHDQLQLAPALAGAPAVALPRKGGSNHSHTLISHIPIGLLSHWIDALSKDFCNVCCMGLLLKMIWKLQLVQSVLGSSVYNCWIHLDPLLDPLSLLKCPITPLSHLNPPQPATYKHWWLSCWDWGMCCVAGRIL